MGTSYTRSGWRSEAWFGGQRDPRLVAGWSDCCGGYQNYDKFLRTNIVILRISKIIFNAFTTGIW